jgi:DNA-binding transcriptional ArsR family regulator
MHLDSNLAPVAAMIGDPARASMMMALMNGRALTAKELAYAARISASTASAHLAKLLDLGLVAVEPQGRNRYYRIASPQVAQMIEAVALLAPAEFRRPHLGRGTASLQLARTCYDHMAGVLGVAIADRLQAENHVVIADGGGVVTARGVRFFASLGILSEPIGGTRRVFCRPCLDWTERRHHLAGALGAALCDHCLQRGWVERLRDSRALRISPSGQRAFADYFGIDVEGLAAPAESVAA